MSKKNRNDLTPEQALVFLVEGNQRFVGGETRERDLMSEVRETANGQNPFAAVLTCIDSRVPPELIFDQGIGDIFCVRVAGNIVNTDVIGSLEYAAKIAGAHIIAVLGHTDCGAVKGACDEFALGSLSQTLTKLAPAISATTGFAGKRNSKNAQFVREVGHQNARIMVHNLITQSQTIRDLVLDNRLLVVAAMYDVATGQVSFVQ